MSRERNMIGLAGAFAVGLGANESMQRYNDGVEQQANAALEEDTIKEMQDAMQGDVYTAAQAIGDIKIQTITETEGGAITVVFSIEEHHTTAVAGNPTQELTITPTLLYTLGERGLFFPDTKKYTFEYGAGPLQNSALGTTPETLDLNGGLEAIFSKAKESKQ